MSPSGGHIVSDISNIDIFVNIDSVSKQLKKYRYFNICILSPKKNRIKNTPKNIQNTKKKGAIIKTSGPVAALAANIPF